MTQFLLMDCKVSSSKSYSLARIKARNESEFGGVNEAIKHFLIKLFVNKEVCLNLFS